MPRILQQGPRPGEYQQCLRFRLERSPELKGNELTYAGNVFMAGYVTSIRERKFAVKLRPA